MNQNKIEKLEADLQQVETTLARAREELKNLLPEMESISQKMEPEKDHGHHAGWFGFLSHKS